MATVERMYESNGRTPVVLVCHSLGTKVGHYLCDFAGREWCDRYVHTYMPVGAPHLGAPKALRGNVTGDAMVSFPYWIKISSRLGLPLTAIAPNMAGTSHDAQPNLVAPLRD